MTSPSSLQEAKMKPVAKMTGKRKISKVLRLIMA
jgi:hypothetical protein